MDKNARIAELLKKRGIKTKVNNDITKRTGNGPCSLSFGQQRLWYMDQLTPNQSVYNLPSAFILNGSLDFVRLKDSIKQVIKRHESLRTRFEIIENIPMQVIDAEVDLNITLEEFEHQSDSEQDSKLFNYLSQLASQPFDLNNDLLIRSHVLKFSDQHHLLFLMTHHIISDGASMTNLINEIACFYSAGDSNDENKKTLKIDDLSVQYADYTVWQNDFLSGSELERELSYWRNIFKKPIPTLNLTTDYSRPPTQSYDGKTRFFKLHSGLTKSIETVAKQTDSSVYIILLTALKILFSRYAEQDDIVIGTLVRNRPKKQLEPLIGFFANTLAIRTELEPDKSVKHTINQVRNNVLDAQKHQALPFEKLVAELNIERDFSRTPLFQILMGYQHVSERSVKTNSLSFNHQSVPANSSKTDLAFFFSQDNDNISLEITYCTALFKQQSVDNLYANFIVLLESMMVSEQTPVNQLEILSSYDRETCRSDDYVLPEKNISSVLELFANVVKQKADSPSILFCDNETSYRQLDEQSNQLAHFLIKQGVKKGELIGLCLGRGERLLVCILAIFKAGCAYLPLDPEFPEDRLDFMLEDSGVSLVLTENLLIEKLSNLSSDQKFSSLCLDYFSSEIEKESPEPLAPNCNESDLAYVIYTSGSTGKPKGVEIEHRALAHFLQQMALKPGILNTDKVLLITTFSFDISILEMLLPLSVGATCVIADDKAVYDGQELINLLERAGVTLMQATPSLWRLLLISGWQGNQNLKALSGGEALSQELAEKLMTIVGSLWNMYGPTETTIWSSCVEIIDAKKNISIGKAIGDTQLFCLDSFMRQTPIGVPGELYISGRGLARGYLKRPELTKQRFIEGLNIDGVTYRAYRTGDQVKFTHEGELECLGRLDSQVKLRGHRIELGEIENVLAGHESITQAAARIFQMSEDDLRLVAYYVPESDSPQPTNTELRRFLTQSLPEYMIPQFFVSITELPRTVNGKLDRLALPDPRSGTLINDDNLVAPESEAEIEVAKIWNDALGHDDPLSVSDNFFIVGGHSMLAVSVIAKIETVTGIRVEPMLMATGTLGQIAKQITNLQPLSVESLENSKTSFVGKLKSWLQR